MVFAFIEVEVSPPRSASSLLAENSCMSGSIVLLRMTLLQTKGDIMRNP